MTTTPLNTIASHVSARAARLGLLLVLVFPFRSPAPTLPPVITTQPADASVVDFGTTNFQVVVTSLSTLTYQWRKNGTAISGATASSYSITNAQPVQQGMYSVKVSNSAGSVISSNAVLAVLTNTAPVLDPSKHPAMADVYEDPGSPSGAVGTLVSQLVTSANVTDPDTNALLGIAITASDSSHGSWSFSTDGGTTWNPLGAVSDMSARLLAADANTRLYFNPSTNWNGMVSNAITFRAWDRTWGTNGAMACARSSGNMLDRFQTLTYTNNDGSDAWSGGWVDIDGNPLNGSILVQGVGQLAVRANNSTDWIYRQADLSGVASAMVSFDYENDFPGSSGGLIYFQVSKDGGATYTTLAGFSATSNTVSSTFSADISSYASSSTRVRFQIVGKSSPTRQLTVDNVQISFTSSSVGGAGAFSTARESASLYVIPVNDPPVANNQSVTTAGGLAKQITLTASDVENDPLTFSIATGPSHGTLNNLNATNGSVLYTPSPGFAGPDSFTFVANDGQTNSQPATVSITVTPVAPSITTQPQGLTVDAGQSASFSVVAGGTAPLSYQWSCNGKPVSGGTASTLVLASARPTNAGNYTVMVTNASGSVTSSVAVLAVNPPPVPDLRSAGMAANGFSFQVNAAIGYTYIVLGSTDLQNWVPVSTNVAASTSLLIADTSVSNYPVRFYRVMRSDQ